MIPLSLKAAATVVLAATPALVAAAEPAATAKPAKGDEIVCHMVVPTGTRMGTRVCGTRAQWDAMSAKQQEGLDKIRNRAGIQNRAEFDH